MSGDDFKVIKGELVKKRVKSGELARLVMGPLGLYTTSEKGQWNWNYLSDFVLQSPLFYILRVVAGEANEFEF